MYRFKCKHCNKVTKSKRTEKFCQHCGKGLILKPMVNNPSPITPQDKLERCIMPSLADSLGLDFYELMKMIKDEDFVKHLDEIGAI